jgi:hypothetical protein
VVRAVVHLGAAGLDEFFDLALPRPSPRRKLVGRRIATSDCGVWSCKKELIDYTRGRILVLDRERLEKRSCECYAVVRKGYDRLLPDSYLSSAPNCSDDVSTSAYGCDPGQPAGRYTQENDPS